MKDFKNLDLSKLRLSHQKKWDKKSVLLLLPVSTYGDDISGQSSFVVAKLHGDDSIVPTGVVTIQGVARTGYGTTKFHEGKIFSVGAYYEGMCDFTKMFDTTPKYRVRIDGVSHGALDTLLKVLNAELAEIINPEMVPG